MASLLDRRVSGIMRDNQQTRVGQSFDEYLSQKASWDKNQVFFTVSPRWETMLGTL